MLLVLPLAVPALLYLLLSIPGIQNSLGSRAENELSRLLGSQVSIGRVEFFPFNRIALADVSIQDPLNKDKECLHIGHLGLGVSLSESLWNRYPVVTYAELLDVSVNLRRDSLKAPLNIDPILDRLKSKDDTEHETPFHLAVNMVVIRRSSISYDVSDRPVKEDGVFDPNHIKVYGLRADLRAPYISNNSVSVQIKRLGASEQSGLTLSALSAHLDMSKEAMTLGDLSLSLPGSQLQFDDITLDGSPLKKGWTPLSQTPVMLNLLPGAHVATADLSPLLPALQGLNKVLELQLQSSIAEQEIAVERLSLSLPGRECDIEFKGKIRDFDKGRDSVAVNIDMLNMAIDLGAVINTVNSSDHQSLRNVASQLSQFSSLGVLNLLGRGAATVNRVSFDGSLTTSCGDIDFNSCVVGLPSEKSPAGVTGSVV
ncbi:MAG: hypothetical protein K2K72_07815, partial [Duncaniella sp.]|nr:hypothetical protein [Duncaniella sp.]